MGSILQREASPGTAGETNRNGALNTHENPSRPLVENGQVLLGSSQDKCREAAVQMAISAHTAARESGFSFSSVASVSGENGVAITRAFDRADPPKAFIALAGLLLLDTTDEWLRGACRLKGLDVVKKPKLTDAQKVERLEAAIRRLGRPGDELITEAYEDAP